MGYKEQLKDIRAKIDELDGEFIDLFARRMAFSREIARVKGENNLAIWDETREQQIVDRAVGRVDNSLAGEAALLMRAMLSLSRGEQHAALFKQSAPMLPPARPPLSETEEKIVCAYQGVPGAWSEMAVRKFFPDAERAASEYFDDVFKAVKRGDADYGVVPIENSQTGAIGETYDLLRRHGCFVVGKLWIDIKQCLLGKPDAEIDDIREVYSHPEGFKQCRQFLNHRAWDLTAQRNTAVAAELAAAAPGKRVAAIGSRYAAELNGLKVLAPDITDDAGNRTCFVVIASQPEYSERDKLLSITFSTQHRPGSLCETLLPFMAQNINMMRIESRPVAEGKYRFFVELEANILDPVAVSALRQATHASDYLEVLGCYTLLL